MPELDPKSLLSGMDPKALLAGVPKLVERFGDEAYFAALCIRSGMVGPELPHRVAQMLLAFERFGLLGGAISAGAIRHGDHTAIVDERGSLTYRELDQRTNAIANAWRGQGFEPGEGVAVLVRNHRGFLEAVFAAAKCGARIILLNTSFAGPQIRDVATREGTDLLVYDEEYAEMLEGVDPPRGRFRAWAEEPGEDTLDALIEAGSTKTPPRPGTTPRITILTSGTTGTPKGAPRSEPRSLSLIGGLLSKVPYRAREVTELAVPMFHALGFAQAVVGIGLGSALVVHRRFDPEKTLDSMAEHRATALVAVPVMLQRMVDLGEDKIKQRDLSALRIIFVSGSALGADLARRGMEAFGPVIYNLYGSTEIAYATIATPEDLAEEPSTVGRIVRGSVVKIFDEHGHELPGGQTGRIFVGNLSQFEGYTGGGNKEVVQGLMSSGDVGHFDEKGRLFIDGRDDEMIVSGGENVFPAEVEELLAGHEAIQEAAAIGVDDEKFGQRLRAFVVLHGGAQLSEDDVKKYVKDNLANYKVPREVVFVDELPRNQTGKVLKRELAERADGQAKAKRDGNKAKVKRSSAPRRTAQSAKSK
ncbi:MAG TPA: acyl-CoA synthetase [Solirubrobacteraceae bacterium]|nr:acyl-CoA synthetase [Solirubrobacteraceae bacterium]